MGIVCNSTNSFEFEEEILGNGSLVGKSWNHFNNKCKTRKNKEKCDNTFHEFLYSVFFSYGQLASNY